MNVNVSVDHAIGVLNRIHKADSSVLNALINYRVPCNEELADDPTVQVGKRNPGPGMEVGLLGIINGIFGVQKDNTGYIAAVADGNGMLIRFERNEHAG